MYLLAVSSWCIERLFLLLAAWSRLLFFIGQMLLPSLTEVEVTF